MFRNRHHIHAKNNEWYVIHRNQKSNWGILQIIGVGIAGLIVASIACAVIAWIVELFLAALPFLLVFGAIGIGIYCFSKLS